MTPCFHSNFRIQDIRNDLTLKAPTEKELIAMRIKEDKARIKRNKVRRLWKLLRALAKKAKGGMIIPPRQIRNEC